VARLKGGGSVVWGIKCKALTENVGGYLADYFYFKVAIGGGGERREDRN